MAIGTTESNSEDRKITTTDRRQGSRDRDVRGRPISDHSCRSPATPVVETLGTTERTVTVNRVIKVGTTPSLWLCRLLYILLW